MKTITRQEIINKIYDDLGDCIPYRISLKILDYLTDNRAGNLCHITYGSLIKVVGNDYSGEQVIETIMYLCGDSTPILDINFEFIENDDVYSISKSEVNAARKDKIFVHPKTGNTIINYEDYLYMYFTPSSLIISIGE